MRQGTLQAGRRSSYRSWATIVAMVPMLLSRGVILQAAPVVAAQTAPRIAYPSPNVAIPGPDIPISISGGAGSNGAALEVTLDGSVQAGAEFNGGTVLLRDVSAGDHQVTIQPRGAASDPAMSDTVSFTVLPPLDASIRMGICDGFNPDPVDELGTLSIDGAEGESDGATTFPLGVPAATPVVVTTSIVNQSLDTFLERAHSIIVSAASTSGGAPDTVACGEIGGALEGGTLRFGLSGIGEREAFGIATFAEQGEQTNVLIEVVQSSGAPSSLDAGSIVGGSSEAALASVNQGICAGLATDVAFDLEPLGTVNGEAEQNAAASVALAATVMSSSSRLDVLLTDLLTRAHAVIVRTAGIEGVADDTVIACGTIGGPVLNGALRVGLGSVDSSGYAGVAAFSVDGSSTSVQLEIVRGEATGGGLASGGDDSPPPPTSAASAPTPDLAEEAPLVQEPPAETVVPAEPAAPVEPEEPSAPPAATLAPLPPTEVPAAATDIPVPTKPPPTVPVEETVVPETELPVETVVSTEPLATEPPPEPSLAPATEAPEAAEPDVTPQP